jgi:hypothetical protein
MAIGRISGQLLKDNLLRDRVNLKFENDLLFLFVNSNNAAEHRIGIKTNAPKPNSALDVNGKAWINEIETEMFTSDNVEINDNYIRSSIGDLVLRAATSNDGILITNNVKVEGNLHATGNITADGSLTLGDADTDDIIFQADINSNIIPNIHQTYDLGKDTKAWRRVFVDDLRLGDPELLDGYDFAQTSIPGSGTLPAKIFTGITGDNYTKINNNVTDGHLALSSNGNGLIELVNDTRVHQDLNVLGDIATDNANYILLGDPEYGILDGAVGMTPQTSLTDGVAQLNLTLTLLVPPSPPSFPNGQQLPIANLEIRIINLPAANQLLNNNPITAPSRGTQILVSRNSNFITNPLPSTGPGNRGTITVKRNQATTVTKLLTYGNSTQIITTVFTGTTNGSQEVKYTQPSAGVLIVGYLIRTADAQIPFGGLQNNQTYIITAISSKVMKISIYNVATGSIGAPFVATSTATGSMTFSSIDDTGDYTLLDTNLYLSNNVAYPLTTPGFHEVVDYQVNGINTPAGWNTVQIIHSDAGQTPFTLTTDTGTNSGIWYYDSSPTLTPVFSSLVFNLKTQSLNYSSTIPHYNSSTKYQCSFILTWNGGETGHDSVNYPLIRTNDNGPWQTAGSKTYADLAYTYLEPTTTVSNGVGPNNTDFTFNVITGFGAWTTLTTVPEFRVDNSYSSEVTSTLPPLNAIILYKTGTNGSANFLEETNIAFTSAVGGSTAGARRCVNPDAGVAGQDTPVFTAGSELFNSQNSTLLVTDAIVVGTSPGVNSLKHDRTNYSIGYLPAGPNLSGRSATEPQYFTFRFTRSGVSKFSLTYATTTGVAAIYCAMPGVGGTVSSLNKWLDLRIDNSLANGCALGGNMNPSATGTLTYNCSFGILNSTNADGEEIWVRIRLNSGQRITRLTLGTSTV